MLLTYKVTSLSTTEITYQKDVNELKDVELQKRRKKFDLWQKIKRAKYKSLCHLATGKKVG